MADDSKGWLEAEASELKNHRDNGSFTLIDRNDFEAEAPGRCLLRFLSSAYDFKLVWVYKRKRNGKMKARLCVQGCSQQPGVDYISTKHIVPPCEERHCACSLP